MATKKEKTIDVTPLDAKEKAPKARVVKKTAAEKEEAKQVASPQTDTVKEHVAQKTESHAIFQGPVMLGLGLLLLGIVLLVGELLGFRFGVITWPFIFIVPGSVIFWSALSSQDARAEGWAIFGSMMVALGIVFLLQQLLDMWASWAYAWALIAPTSIGVAQVIFGKQHNRDSIVKNGKGLIEVGLTLFLVFFVFFELILNISGKNLIPFGLPAFPVALIVLGVFVILRSVLKKK